MKILHVQGFSARYNDYLSTIITSIYSSTTAKTMHFILFSERAEKAHHIRHNIHESIHDIVDSMDMLNIPLQNPKNTRSREYILKLGDDGPMDYTEVSEFN